MEMTISHSRASAAGSGATFNPVARALSTLRFHTIISCPTLESREARAEPIFPMPAMPIFMKRSLLVVAALALAACRSGMTPLHIAAQAGDTRVVKQWIADRKNLDPRYDEASRGLEGNYARLVDVTPLMLAAGNGQLETVQLLVEG